MITFLRSSPLLISFRTLARATVVTYGKATRLGFFDSLSKLLSRRHAVRAH